MGLPYAVICVADDAEAASHTAASPNCYYGEKCVQCTALLCGEPVQEVRFMHSRMTCDITSLSLKLSTHICKCKVIIGVPQCL